MKFQNLLLNEDEIKQGILNIVKNALDASSEGNCVNIETFSTYNKIVLSIKDNGKGIAPEILGKVGTTFSTNKLKGTGLGLSISNSIVEQHNGKI